MKASFQLYPVGRVRKTEAETVLEIDPAFNDALLGLETFSHIVVLYWFHENDDPENRSTHQVHPRKNPRNPLTGVFATHAPLRPNLIAISTCRIESIDGNTIKIDEIDAHDGSPIIDIKCYLPSRKKFTDLKIPDWIK
ncbi:MAG: tRNA (N6-threonylcarbamoyladenosine(37)-N6)-methyltransferase TrmO [Deltaproteobacteria bacterium]|nr:tRNA (N6-threonylcarbamoyladenosine(37)-N6)-methyltransferase TrmO [Deltaproteobacteria bacterium]